jgi:hypothetical protein
MINFIQTANKHFSFGKIQKIYNVLFVMAIILPICGCTPKVHVPTLKKFYYVSPTQSHYIDIVSNEKQLLDGLYKLIKANEGEKVPLCTAQKDAKECEKDGFSVFVFGGFIPGIGSRSYYRFKDIEHNENSLKFTKENRSTTFIGTPMLVLDNTCKIEVRDGGLQVEMPRYYATWLGLGQMFMAEGWAIDYINMKTGVVGLQLELDIKGILVLGGGSRYVLLKFPNIP